MLLCVVGYVLTVCSCDAGEPSVYDHPSGHSESSNVACSLTSVSIHAAPFKGAYGPSLYTENRGEVVTYLRYLRGDSRGPRDIREPLGKGC